MKLPFRHTREVSRGQAMVEFAIILPLLGLLLVMAVDFGRVFFGWVGLQNAARIAANAAALHPDAWDPPGNASGQATYRDLVLADLQALNCQPVGGGTWTAASVPAPVFEDRPSTSFSSDAYEVGDHAIVDIDCEFGLLTPIASTILGSPIEMGATAQFAVRGGVINGVPVGAVVPGSGCLDKTVPTLIGLTVADARTAWGNAGFTGGFAPPPGSTDTDIVEPPVTTTPPSNPGDCLVATASVVVSHAPATTCSGTDVLVPLLQGATVAQARSTWSTSFPGGTFSPPPGGSDADIVDGQSVPDGTCMPPDTDVTVTHSAPPPPMCEMPQIIGLRVNSGETSFQTQGFTGTYTITRPPSGNYILTTQSLIGGQDYVCTASVTVAGN